MRKDIVFLFILITLLVITYYPSLSNNFTYLDDQEQVVNNASILSLSLDNLKQIFSSTSVGMYQPITTSVYALIYQFFGLSSFGFHLTSLLFHFINCLLVLLLLKDFIQDKRILFLLVSVFALHPMQVESVAWISAFSTIVSTTFYLLSLIFYMKYESKGVGKNYILCLTFYILACLSKSMAVTLPLIILLLDYFRTRNFKKIRFFNKIPFFLLSIIFGFITIYSRESAGHLSDLSIQFNGFERIFLIAYSILFYPIKFIIPIQLSTFYPFPNMVDNLLPLTYYLALPTLLILFFLIYKYRQSYKLLFGFLFYLISISLVIQLIPVGNQLTADRYLYLAMAGILIIFGSALEAHKNKKWLYVLFLIPIFFSFQSRERSKIWSNDQLIWENVIKNYPHVAQAYNNLGSYIQKYNQVDQALIYFNKAIQLKPYYADAFSNRGNLFALKGDSKAAIIDYNQAIELRPHADAYFNRGNEFSKLDDLNSAISDYTLSIELKPSPDALTNRAFAFLKQSRINQAKKDLQEAIELFPKYDRSYFLMGLLLKQQGKKIKACDNFQLAYQQGNKDALKVIEQYCQSK